MFDADAARRFYDLIKPVDGCIEMRVVKARENFKTNHIEKATGMKATFAGWFDNAASFVAEAAKVSGVSAYVVPNPAPRDLLSRSYNKLIQIEEGKATKDDDIISLRWMLVDIDAVRTYSDLSSTEIELQNALDRREDIFSDFPEWRDSSLCGRSGNGAFILVHLPDYPNDETHRRYVVRMINHLHEKYSDDKAEVDIRTKNPARLMCLPGTMKCKSSNTPDRPWRMATLDSLTIFGGQGEAA